MRTTLWNLVARVFVLVLLIAAADKGCQAHDKWANGAPIPQWVKNHCCSGDEAINLGDASVVHPVKGADGSVTGFKVDGYNNPVAVVSAYPSQDGRVWIFRYRGADPDNPIPESQAAELRIYCIFIPCFSRDDLPADSGLDSSCS